MVLTGTLGRGGAFPGCAGGCGAVTGGCGGGWPPSALTGAAVSSRTVPASTNPEARSQRCTIPAPRRRAYGAGPPNSTVSPRVPSGNQYNVVVLPVQQRSVAIS